MIFNQFPGRLSHNRPLHLQRRTSSFAPNDGSRLCRNWAVNEEQKKGEGGISKNARSDRNSVKKSLKIAENFQGIQKNSRKTAANQWKLTENAENPIFLINPIFYQWLIITGISRRLLIVKLRGPGKPKKPLKKKPPAHRRLLKGQSHRRRLLKPWTLSLRQLIIDSLSVNEW